MKLKLILAFVGLVILAFVGVWSFEKWDAKPFVNVGHESEAPNTASSGITPFQRQMFKQGYARDHVTHRWFPIWEAYTNNGCAEYGTPLETTFNCRTPLTGGVPDEK
jgi:hypothetical protein